MLDFTVALVVGDLVDDMIWTEVPVGQFFVAVGALFTVHLALDVARFKSSLNSTTSDYIHYRTPLIANVQSINAAIHFDHRAIAGSGSQGLAGDEDYGVACGEDAAGEPLLAGIAVAIRPLAEDAVLEQAPLLDDPRSGDLRHQIARTELHDQRQACRRPVS